MTSIDVIVGIHPERVRSLVEIEGILSKIVAYENVLNCKGGVVVKQNGQFGGSYRVVSEAEAKDGLLNKGKYEWYVSFFPRDYFENKRNQLSS